MRRELEKHSGERFVGVMCRARELQRRCWWMPKCSSQLAIPFYVLLTMMPRREHKSTGFGITPILPAVDDDFVSPIIEGLV